MKHWVNFIAAPSTGAGTFSTVFIKMFDEAKLSEEPMAEHIVNEIGLKDKMIRQGNMPDRSINTLFKNLSQSIKADRIYIMELQGDKLSNTFEWCAKGVESVLEKWQNIDFEVYVSGKEDFLPGTSMVINNVNDCKYLNPKRAGLMSGNGIKNIIEIPFYINGKLFGFIGVDNYDPKEEKNVRLLLEHTSYFLEYNEELRKAEVQNPATP